MNAFERLRKELEPDALVEARIEFSVAASQAISLRRIADTLEKLDKRLAEIRGEIGHGGT